MPKLYILRRLATNYPVEAVASTWSGNHYFRLISIKPSPTSSRHWEGVIELLEAEPLVTSHEVIPLDTPHAYTLSPQAA
jgi:hypothetical protein